MSRLADLHSAVLADLDSDEPRLVLADALQAEGDPRGELIAIQCELARLGCDRTRVALWDTEQPEARRKDWIGDAFRTGGPDQIRMLRGRESVLLKQLGAEWARGLRSGYRFGRGFVDHVFTDQMLPEMFDRAPYIRSLEYSISDGGASLLAEPRARQLRQLRFSFAAHETAHVRRLLETGHEQLVNLRELAIAGIDGGDRAGTREAIKGFLASPIVAQLEALDLHGQAIDRPQRIIDLLKAAPLRDLRLGGHSLHDGESVGRAFALSPGCATLEILDLYDVKLEHGLLALADAPYLQGLRALRIHELDPRGFVAGTAAIAAGFPRLELLDFTLDRFAPYVPDLIGGAGLGQLAHLRLRWCGLGDDAARLLAASELASRLRTLDLRDNAISDDGAAAFAQLAPTLELLDLRGNDIEVPTREQLRRALPQTRVLTGIRP